MEPKNSLYNNVRELLWLGYYLTSVSLLLYIFLSYFISALTPDSLFIDQQILSPNTIRILLGLAFFLAMSGWNILKTLHKIDYESPLGLNKLEKILTICCAVLLGYVFGGSLQITSAFSFLFFISFTVGFAYLLPQLLNFYSYLNIHHVTFIFHLLIRFITNILSFNKKGKSIRVELVEEPIAVVITKKQLKTLSSIFMSLLLISVAAIILFISITKYTSGQTIRENKLRKLFYITAISPEHTTPGRTAKLVGYNFGIKTDTNYQVLTSDGIVLEIVTWDKDFIEFFIPLSLPMGNHKIWIVRPTDELHRDQGFRKSNKISLEVHSRFSLLPDVDDSKFDRGVKKIKKFLIDTYPQLSPWIFSVYKYE